MSSCIFCAILDGKADASVVLDEEVYAFLDLFPWSKGHTLIIPRRHVQYVGELTPEERSAMFEAGSRIGTALRASGLADDVHFVLNDGPIAAQTVPHAHLHVVPRVERDKRRMIPRLLTAMVPPLWKARRSELDEVAEQIRAALPPA